MRYTTPLDIQRGPIVKNEHAARVNSLSALVLDQVDEHLLKALRDQGIKLDVSPGIDRDKLLERIKDYDIILGRTRMPIDAEMIAAAPNLKVIGRAAVGIENIDTEEAARHGIKVINVPGAATDSVAELTIALVFNALRKVSEGVSLLKEGTFKKSSGIELSGKTVGIIGFGRIGKRFAEFLRPFNNTILIYDVVQRDYEVYEVNGKCVSLEEVMAKSDIISLHVSMEANGTPVIGKREFELMGRHPILINTVRAAAVDSHALYEHLKNGVVSAYASDVLLNEPPKEPIELELLKLKNVIITPHIGASTAEAQRRVAEQLAPDLIESVRNLARA